MTPGPGKVTREPGWEPGWEADQEPGRQTGWEPGREPGREPDREPDREPGRKSVHIQATSYPTYLIPGLNIYVTAFRCCVKHLTL